MWSAPSLSSPTFLSTLSTNTVSLTNFASLGRPCLDVATVLTCYLLTAEKKNWSNLNPECFTSSTPHGQSRPRYGDIFVSAVIPVVRASGGFWTLQSWITSSCLSSICQGLAIYLVYLVLLKKAFLLYMGGWTGGISVSWVIYKWKHDICKYINVDIGFSFF